MVKTVLYAEKLYDNDSVEREVFGQDVRVVWRNVGSLSQLEERDCVEIDGLMVMRHAVTADPKSFDLRSAVRLPLPGRRDAPVCHARLRLPLDHLEQR